MSLTNFNNVKAAEIQPLIDQIWKEPSTAKSYGVKAHTIKAILENQTAQLQLLESADKLNEVSVKWVDFCGDTSTDGTDADDCDNTLGGEGTAKEKAYALDIFKEDTFSVASEELESTVTSYDEIVATGLAAKIKNIIEGFNKAAVAVIAANKGTNPDAGDYSYDAGTKDTSIPSTDFGGEILIPYFMQVAEANRSQETFILDGKNLFKDYYVAGKKFENSDGKTAASMYDDMQFRHDISGFSTNALSANTFLIDKGALAIANRAKYPTLAQLASAKDGGWIHTSNGNMMRYSIPVNIPEFMPMMFVKQGKLVKQSLMIDVQHSIVCSGNLLYPTWKLKLRAGVFASPIRCNTGNTGILSFVKVPA